MESPTDPVGALREHERAAALPYIEYPPTPAWYPPAVGAWAALFLACFLYLWREPDRVLGVDPRLAFSACMVGLIALEVGFFTWLPPQTRDHALDGDRRPGVHRAFRLYFGGSGRGA